jgi:hypothetical protein
MTMEAFQTNATRSTHMRVREASAMFSTSGNIVTVPRSQLYFWTEAWQAYERAADDDIANGRTVRFEDPVEAMRWLLDDD